jgi:hypothetical protein
MELLLWLTPAACLVDLKPPGDRLLREGDDRALQPVRLTGG